MITNLPASFKCIQSGNIYQFDQAHDVASMLTHPGYIQIDLPADPVEVEKIVGRKKITLIKHTDPSNIPTKEE